MYNFLEEIKNRILVYDGSKGYLLQKLGLEGADCGELWNVTKPEIVKEVYRQYKKSGSDIIQTNTFPGNRIHLDKYSLGDKTYDINFWGAKLAKEVAGDDILVAASIGPAGILFEPSGELTFDVAYEVFCEQVKAVADGGADIINFETFTDVAEMRVALLAAKDVCDLPVICSIAFENNHKTLMGTDPYLAAIILKSLGADMVGINCSFGAEHMLDLVETMSQAGCGYLSVKPNAGLPEVINGETCYKETPETFADTVAKYANYDARLIGGCCGSTPEYITAIKAKISDVNINPIATKKHNVITSGVKLIKIEDINIKNIGRIDANKDNKIIEELKDKNLGYIEDLSLDISCEGFDAVYINIDLAGGGYELLTNVINVAQGYIKEPLIIETSNPAALEKALRNYKGVAGVVLPEKNQDEFKELVKKYGSEIIGKIIL